MLALETAQIRVGGRAENKGDAIRKVGAILVETGHIDPGYVDSMLARERVANTFLGQGIAIPHGIPKDRGLIKKTGIAVFQVPDGVEWNPGETVNLVVGIAAKSDEHLEILSNLTDVLGDTREAGRLAQTTHAQDIADRLSGRVSVVVGAVAEPQPSDLSNGFDIAITGPHGLHARPATAFADLAKTFASTIRIRHGDKVADGKSLISLLKLGVGSGNTIRVMAEGPDAELALARLRMAIEVGLEDEAEAAADSCAASPAPTVTIDYQGRTIPGLSASPGMAIGPITQFHRSKIVVAATAQDQKAELARLSRAMESARRELNDLFNEVWKTSGPGKAGIFRAHLEFLDDPEMVDAARQLIRQGRSAGYAWQHAYEDRAGILASMKDTLLSSRAIDLRDVGRRVLKLLADSVEDEPILPTHPTIIVADDLAPSDTARLDPSIVLGVCTASGGPTSHTAIIARSLDIPAVVGAGSSILDLPHGMQVVLDGASGILVVDPTEADMAAARQSKTDQEARREAERRDCYKPAIMVDGSRVEVVANISDAAEAEYAVNAGGEGVGLLRTEFLFLQRDQAPTEDEQAQAYTTMVKALNGLPIIIRTLDIGGDKDVPYLSLPAEDNPFLGERGIRLCLNRQDLFRTQLRAVFRAAGSGPVRLMFPMIATLDELDQAKAIAEAVRQEMGADPVEIGIMIEVPSAVMMARELAREVDFFSIGTNDLTQYVLAMDRLHPTLAKQADGLHPAVLRMIDQTVKAAKAEGIWVGACGGIAGDPKGVAILAGLGVSELSVSIPSIAAVKAQIRSLSQDDARRLARQALDCASAAEVRTLS